MKYMFPLIYARIKFFCLTNMDEQTIIFSDSESFIGFFLTSKSIK